jgi:hypothetical protein
VEWIMKKTVSMETHVTGERIEGIEDYSFTEFE